MNSAKQTEQNARAESLQIGKPKQSKCMAKKTKNLVVAPLVPGESSAPTATLEQSVRIPSNQDIVSGILSDPDKILTTTTFKQLMIACENISINEENRGGVGIDPIRVNDYSADMKENGWKAGSILEVESLGKGQYLCWSGNHRLLAARKAGFLSVPCIILPVMSKTDRLVFGWKSNEVKRNSPIETALLVANLTKEGNKPGQIAGLMFAGKTGGPSQVSQYMSFVKSCPAWLCEAVKTDRVSYKTAQDLIPLFAGSETPELAEKRAQIESTEPGQTWIAVSIVKEARDKKAQAAREQVEKVNKAAKEKESKESKEKTELEKKAAVEAALSDKLAQEKHAALVKDVSELLALPTGEDSQDEAFDAMEKLVISTHGEQSYKNEAKRQLDAKSAASQQGGSLVPASTPPDIKIILDQTGSKEQTPGQIESASATLTPEQKAALLLQPSINEGVTIKTGQANPQQEHPKSISIKLIRQRAVAISTAFAKTLPNNEVGAISEWVSNHCTIGADGHAYARVNLGHATVRFLVDLGSDMVS